MDVAHIQPNFLAVDFYCGAGGTTRGMIDAGGYVIAGIDKDEACLETYVQNNPNLTGDRAHPGFLALDMFEASESYPHGEQDKVRDALQELIPKFRDAYPHTPLMFAICAPCQAFTKFVQRRLTDRRTGDRVRDQHLLAQTLGLIDEFRPEVVISENVAAISTGKYRHVWLDFARSLQQLGYNVARDQVCASKFGVPQRRRRSILAAVRREGEMIDLQIPECDPNAELVSVENAIGHLPAIEAGETSVDIPNHTCRNLSKTNRRRLMSLSPGEANFNLSESRFGDLSLACHRRLESSGKRGFGDVYTRMHPDRPSPTITTRFHSISNGRFGHYDPVQVRGISLREGALLQSFSEDYRFHGTGMDSIARMIGNAVPPVLSKFMSSWAVSVWRQQCENSPTNDE